MSTYASILARSWTPGFSVLKPCSLFYLAATLSSARIRDMTHVLRLCPGEVIQNDLNDGTLPPGGRCQKVLPL